MATKKKPSGVDGLLAKRQELSDGYDAAHKTYVEACAALKAAKALCVAFNDDNAGTLRAIENADAAEKKATAARARADQAVAALEEGDS